MSDPRCFGKESKRPPRILARQAGNHISNVDAFSLFGYFLQRYINYLLILICVERENEFFVKGARLGTRKLSPQKKQLGRKWIFAV